MNPSIAAVLELYKFDNSLFLDRIGSLENQLVIKRITENSNPIIWISGHLTNTRYHVLELLGTKIEFPWPKIFEHGFDPATEYPDISKIKDSWIEISDKLIEKVEQVADSHLLKELHYKLPHNDNTVRGAIIFFAYHESWHLGQISYIRKCLELDGLVPY